MLDDVARYLTAGRSIAVIAGELGARPAILARALRRAEVARRPATRRLVDATRPVGRSAARRLATVRQRGDPTRPMPARGPARSARAGPRGAVQPHPSTRLDDIHYDGDENYLRSPTTRRWCRRRISLFGRSCGLLERIWGQCSTGRAVNARMSSAASSTSLARSQKPAWVSRSTTSPSWAATTGPTPAAGKQEPSRSTGTFRPIVSACRRQGSQRSQLDGLLDDPRRAVERRPERHDHRAHR